MNGRAVVVVCRPAIARGFALAGLATFEASSPAEGEASLRTLLGERERIGLILVDATIYDALGEEVRRDLARRLPLVAPFAAPTWTHEAPTAGAIVAELLGQSVGYRVRLR